MMQADLGLSKGVIGGAGMAALAVSIVLRIVMVYLVRMYGPRYCQVRTGNCRAGSILAGLALATPTADWGSVQVAEAPIASPTNTAEVFLTWGKHKGLTPSWGCTAPAAGAACASCVQRLWQPNHKGHGINTGPIDPGLRFRIPALPPPPPSIRTLVPVPQVFLLLLTAPALACMGAVVDGPWFVLVRLAVGSSLGLFVVAQFWVVAHFSSEACGPAAGGQCRTREALGNTQGDMSNAPVCIGRCRVRPGWHEHLK